LVTFTACENETASRVSDSSAKYSRDKQMTELDFIRHALDDMAIVVRAKYAARDGLVVSSKAEANDLLTEVDLAVQAELVARIHADFPSDAIYAEESGLNRTPTDLEGRVWLIDPIDGTQNFVRGLFPAFGISLAFAINGRPVVGGVAVPGKGELFLAEHGAGAYRNGERLRVSAIASIAHARVEVDFSCPSDRTETLKQFSRLIVETGQIRCHCAAVIGLCSIATGDMDAFVHVTLNAYDYAAAMVIVEEAGGLLTRLNGDPIHLFDGKPGVLGSNGLLHAQFFDVIRRVQ